MPVKGNGLGGKPAARRGPAGDSPRAADVVKLYFTWMFVCLFVLLNYL